MLDDGRRVKPSRLVFSAVFGGLSAVLTTGLAVQVGWASPVVLVVALLAAGLSIILVGCVAAVARAAWLHRFTVFTNMKSNVDPD